MKQFMKNFAMLLASPHLMEARLSLAVHLMVSAVGENGSRISCVLDGQTSSWVLPWMFVLMLLAHFSQLHCHYSFSTSPAVQRTVALDPCGLVLATATPAHPFSVPFPYERYKLMFSSGPRLTWVMLILPSATMIQSFLER